MKKLFDSVYVDSSLMFELFGFMFRLANYKKLLKQNTNDEINIIIRNTRELLSKKIQDELEVFFNVDSFLAMSLTNVLWENKKHKNISEAIAYLKSLTSDDIIHKFFNTGYGQSFNVSDIHNMDEVMNYLNISALPEKEKWKLFYFCSNTETIKIRLISLIEIIYNNYFTNYIEEIKKQHQQSFDEIFKIINNLDDLYDLIGFSNHENNDDDQVVLFPSYFYNTNYLLSYDLNTNTLICVYGIKRLSEMKNISDSVLSNNLKAIADENRLKIIKLLLNSSHYGHELSKSLNLSNSTISHHLSLLTKCGFVKSNRKENKVYYEICKEQIESFLVSLKLFLLEK